MNSTNPSPAQDSQENRVHAAQMLLRASLVADLQFQDALFIAEAMNLVEVPEGTVIMQEGQTEDTDFLALLLEGEVRAESAAYLPGEGVVISIIEPGQFIGEMGLLDGAPRSATCTALSDLQLATLSRDTLQGLVRSRPELAARLLLGLAQAIAIRLRESNRRLRTLSRVTRALQLELDATHAVNQRLLGADVPRH